MKSKFLKITNQVGADDSFGVSRIAGKCLGPGLQLSSWRMLPRGLPPPPPHQLFPPPQPGRSLPPAGEGADLFSLVSNLFLYDLLYLFVVSTIKPLKHIFLVVCHNEICGVKIAHFYHL